MTFNDGDLLYAEQLNGLLQISDAQAADGFKNIGSYESMSAMRSFNPTQAGQVVKLSGYHAGWAAFGYGDIGSGYFYYDALDTSSLDDGGYCVVTTSGKRLKRIIVNNYISICDFGALPDGTDQSSKIQAAINFTKLGMVSDVYVPPIGTFYVSATVNHLSGVRIFGSRYRRNSLDGAKSSQIRRLADVTIFRAIGGTQAVGVSPIEGVTAGSDEAKVTGVEISDIILHTGDFITKPMLNYTGVAYLKINDALLYGKGRQALFWELFDSRIQNLESEWGGDSTLVPAIELRSTNGGDSANPTLEFTNQVYFTGCRAESYLGSAIVSTGDNTNEIYFNNCKYESINLTTAPHIDLANSVGFHFSSVQISTRSDVVASPIRFNKCSNMYGDIDIEFLTSITTIATQYMVNLIDPRSNVLDVRMNTVPSFYQMASAFTISYPTLTEGLYLDTNALRFISSSSGAVVNITNKNITQKIQGRQTLVGLSSEPYTEYRRSDVTTDKWSFGRLLSDGANTMSRIVHNISGVETVLMFFRGDNTIQVPVLFRLGAALRLWSATSEQTFSSDGDIHARSDNKTIAIANNGSYHYVGWSSSVPASGTYKVGDIIFNSAPAASGFIGWVCVTAGTPGTWKTFGSISA